MRAERQRCAMWLTGCAPPLPAWSPTASRPPACQARRGRRGGLEAHDQGRRNGARRTRRAGSTRRHGGNVWRPRDADGRPCRRCGIAGGAPVAEVSRTAPRAGIAAAGAGAFSMCAAFPREATCAPSPASPSAAQAASAFLPSHAGPPALCARCGTHAVFQQARRMRPSRAEYMRPV